MPQIIWSYEPPATGKFALSPEKYNALLFALEHSSDASRLAVAVTTGSVTYQKIDFAWSYDQAAGELTINIVGDHNWKAELAGNSKIFEMLNANLISKLCI